MTCFEQITVFWYCQIWSFIRFMFAGHFESRLGIEAELELEPILVTMKKVEDLIANLDQIQLNKQLCSYLGTHIMKTRASLEYLKRAFASRSTSATDDQKRAFQEIHMVVKHAETLVQKCLCKDSSWLDGAITLADIKEDVMEIHLNLSWWTSVLEMTTVDMEQSKVIQNTKMALENYGHLLENSSSSLEDVAKIDMNDLLAKIKKKKENHGNTSFRLSNGIYTQEYILSVYLFSRITGDAKDIIKEADIQLKEYKDPSLLGKGGYGVVNKVTWLEKKCALKIIDNFNLDIEAKEATLLRSCHHPHIAQFFWYWKDNMHSYIMMEWMPEDLLKHIRNQFQGGSDTPFKWHVAIDIMLQVANAMRYLHNNKKIVHRDLKTSNILVCKPIMESSEGYLQVKLADFGVAKFYNNTQTPSPQTERLGTSTYAPPEANFNQHVVHEDKRLKFPTKVDVWSFAMVCSEILTGQQPFAFEKKVTLHAKIINDGLRPSLPMECPNYLRFCIESCWELSPEMRPNFSIICRNLMLAKTISLGIIPLDPWKHLFLQWNKMEIMRSNGGANLQGGISDMEVHVDNHQGLHMYYLIGTYFTYYSSLSKTQKIVGHGVNYKTGICRKGLETQFKLIFEPHEISMMEGCCWLEHIHDFAYGCLTGLFVNSKHLKLLEEKKIKIVEGGYIGETDAHSITPEIKKFFWPHTMNSTHISTSGQGVHLAASFYSRSEDVLHYMNIYLKYGSDKPALISHLWHGDELVLGNIVNNELVPRVVLGSQIQVESFDGSEQNTFTLSIS